MMVAVRLSVSVIPRLADENLILTYDEHESYCGTDSYTRNPATFVWDRASLSGRATACGSQ